MIQKLIEKLNKKRLKERISSAIVMVALLSAFPVLWEPYPELWSATAIIMH